MSDGQSGLIFFEVKELKQSYYVFLENEGTQWKKVVGAVIYLPSKPLVPWKYKSNFKSISCLMVNGLISSN